MPNKPKKSSKKNRPPQPRKPVTLANNAAPAKRPPAKLPSRPPGPAKHRHVSAVCSVTNPFCTASKASKWPDGTNGNTMVEQFRGNFALTNNSAGKTFAVFSPTLPFGFCEATVALSVATLPAAYTTYKASSMLATFGDKYRIVSMGCIVRCTASATTAAGILTMGTVGLTPAVSSTAPTGTELYDEVLMKSIQPGMEVCWVAQPRGTQSKQFVSQSTSTALTNTWTTLVIEVTGSTVSVPVVNVEWYINCEFTLPIASALSAVAPKNPPKIAAAEVAVSKVHTTLGSFIEGGVAMAENKIMDAATKAVQSFASDPLESLFSLFGG